jgi:hypothetical protein
MLENILMQSAMVLLGAAGTFVLGLIAWGIKSLISAVIKNTNELHVLNSKIENIVTDTKSIPKMKEDLNALHSRVGKVEKELNEGGSNGKGV